MKKCEACGQGKPDPEMTERERMAQALYEAKCRFMRVAPYLWKTLIQDEWISIADAALAFNAERVRKLENAHVEMVENRDYWFGIAKENGVKAEKLERERDEARAVVAWLKAQNAELMGVLKGCRASFRGGFTCTQALWNSMDSLLARIDAENATPATPPPPSISARPALRSCVRRLTDNKWLGVFCVEAFGFWASGREDSARYFYSYDGYGKFWTDLPAEPRRPKVGDKVWVRGGDRSDYPWELRIVGIVGEEYFYPDKWGARHLADHGVTWWFGDERPRT
jgi:hypothetical protein